jgi:signal transduction histidine kinase
MLRTRLMSGLICLLLILLSMGLYSIQTCNDLGRRIDAVVKYNDATGRLIQKMKRSSSVMSGSFLVLVAGDPKQSRDDFNTARTDFVAAIKEEQSNPGLGDEERKSVNALAETFKNYQADASSFLDQAIRGQAGDLAGVRLGAENTALLDQVDQLALVHLNSVNKSNGASASDAVNTVRSLIFLMMLAVVATLAAYLGLARGLLTPLRSLTASIREIGQGNLDQQVPVVSRDELGVLATSFNQMAAQLREYRANTSVELMRLNTTIRATLASFPDPIFVLNAEGAVDFRNPAADELAVKLLFSGVTRLPQKVEEKVKEVRASGEDYLPTIFQDAIKFHVNGQDRYFLPRIVMLRDEAGVNFGVAVILEDVTRILLLDDVKSNLIATVSHELKTPLTSVRMALYLLVERTVGPLNERQSDLVATAREDADRLLRTLNDLLDLAKLEQGPSQLQLADVAPGALVETAAHETRDVAQEAGIKLRTEVTPGLPFVRVDRQRLAYVFVNLLTNAFKYSPGGTTVLVKAERGLNRAEEPVLRFSVRDEGPGIAPEHLDSIFDRFYRVPGSNRTGAGLGLSIAREIVVAHGGEIGVISKPGEGSEFFFVLPYLQVDIQPPT